jgi:methylated-DNA-[protein]-cysteine S-methyltransferase
MTFLIDRIVSPIGTVLVVSDGRSLCAVDFEDYEDRMMLLLRRYRGDDAFVDADDPQGFSSRLRAYFAGRIDALDAIPVNAGGTPFQAKVWAALRTIPAGTTISYGTLAQRIGRPTASRAVGLANGSNPISIVVPCHRVIGADSSLTGYGGGLARKRWLLEHEGVTLPGLAERRVA